MSDEPTDQVDQQEEPQIEQSLLEDEAEPHHARQEVEEKHDHTDHGHGNFMTDDRRTRRQFFVGAGVAGAIGLAGCIGAPQGQNGTDDQHGNTTESGGHDDQHGNTTESGGHDHTDAQGAGIDGPHASATVSMVTANDGSHFEPHVVWVEREGSVTWKLESGSHTTTAYAKKTDKPQRIPDGANAWDSGTLSEQGKTFEHTFETEGIYDYFCIPHETIGMIGTVIVGNPKTEDQPGLQEPQTSLPSEAVKKIKSLNERVTAALNNANESSDHAESHNESSTDDSNSSHD